MQGAEVVVELRSAAIDAERMAVAVAAKADQPAPDAVGRSVIAAIIARAQHLGVAAHALVQRIDDVATIDRSRYRHRRIERNLLAEARYRRSGRRRRLGVRARTRPRRYRTRRHRLKSAAQEPVVFAAGRCAATEQQIVVGACSCKSGKCSGRRRAAVCGVDDQNAVSHRQIARAGRVEKEAGCAARGTSVNHQPIRW